MDKVKKPIHPTAERLLEVGMARGAKDFTEIAKALDATDQSATNWKSRGVPKKKMIEAAMKYGANVAYIQDGVLPMYIKPLGAYSAAIEEVIQIMLKMSEPGQWKLSERAQLLAEQYPLKSKQTPLSQ